MMRYLFAIFLGYSLFIHGKYVSAQIALQASYLKPSGDGFGYYFKPTIGADLVVMDTDIDDQAQIGLSVGFYSLTPRQDTFFSYGLRNGSTYLPAYLIWNSYRSIPISLVLEYRITQRRLSPLLGIDAVMNVVSYSYQQVLTSVINQYKEDVAVTLGVLPRLGIKYQISDFLVLSTSMGRNFAFDTKSQKEASMWKLQLNLTYYPFYE